MDSFSKLIEALAHLIGALAWPVTVLLLALRFAPLISSVSARFRDFTVKGLGLEASATLEKVERTLQAAEENKRVELKSGDDSKTFDAFPVEYIESRHSILYESDISKLSGKNILWVDDTPSRNALERYAFVEAGSKIEVATSTEQALMMAESKNYDFIISDLSRPPDEAAGYTLLKELGKNHPPFIIYSSLGDPRHNEEAKEKGAVGFTNSPTVLLQMVSSVIS